MLTQQCHSDRAKRRGISNNDIRDISRSFDMTSTSFFSIWVNCYIATNVNVGTRHAVSARIVPASRGTSGFGDYRAIQDFPIRGRATYLHVRKRKYPHPQAKERQAAPLAKDNQRATPPQHHRWRTRWCRPSCNADRQQVQSSPA